jgi:hypothetical protein
MAATKKKAPAKPKACSFTPQKQSPLRCEKCGQPLAVHKTRGS